MLILESDKIAKLVKFAEENDYSMNDMLDMKNGQKEIAGNIPGHVYETGPYRIVYSVENQVMGKTRHLSISKNSNLPGVNDTIAIMKAIGFKNDLEDCLLDVEKGEHISSINIWEIIY